MLDINRPPEMRTLIKDDSYKRMLMRNPRIPGNLVRPGLLTPPWQVWVLTTAEKWRKGEFETYVDAFNLMRAKLKDDTTMDLAIVSKRFLMPPPVGFKWPHRKYPWCPRCRRPSVFTTRYSHRNLRGAELTMDDAQRCFFCGIRQAAFPVYRPRIKKPA